MTTVRQYRARKQEGAAVLAISMMMLFIMTIITLYASKTAVIEQKVAANEMRDKATFETAEAGLEIGLAHLRENQSTIIVDADSNGELDAYSNGEISAVTLGSNGSFSVSYTNATAGDLNNIIVTSSATSADGSVTRVIAQNVTVETFSLVGPPVPLVTKGVVDLGGNVSIDNPENQYSIWSGGTTTLSGSADSSNVNGDTSGSGGNGADVAEGDANLGGLSDDEFFANFFGQSKSSVVSNADSTYVNDADVNLSNELDGKTGEVIYIDQSGGGTATINGNTTIGSEDNPVILIVDGDIRMNGTLTVYGMVYINNDWNNSGGGTVDVIGSVIVNGSVQSTGTPNITYDSDVLDSVNTTGSFVKVPGTWRDI